MTKIELASAVTHYESQVIVGLVAVLMYAIVNVIRQEFVTSESVILVILVALSIIATGLYGAGESADRMPGKSPARASLALAGLVPYIACAYICLFEGLWSLVDLLSGFSLLMFLKAGLMMAIGFYVLGRLHHFEEFSRKLREGDMAIEN